MSFLRRRQSALLPTTPEPDEASARDAALPDIDWAYLPEGSRRWWFDAPSGRLASVSMGPDSGPRVVLVPGVTGSKEDFDLVMPILASAGYRVDSYDIAGQYESFAASPPPGGSFDYELYRNDMIAFLEQGGPAHVLGYSFAGIVAEQVVIRRPDLFRSLALMSVPPVAGNGFRTMKWIGPITRFGSGKEGGNLMVWGIRHNFNRATPQRVRFAEARFAVTNMRSVDEVVSLMMHIPDVFSEVRAVDIPKLLIVGSHDLWRPQDHERHAEAIGGDLRIYDAGHSPCEEAPNQMSRDLLRMYASTDATDAANP